eukprot:TRINITY_DN2453_c0_g1_i1.p1 TRINITY_DN2453_c0_g1~~TRINITY_DN2453_c0_g1_i1.p1  ORF type:complete len:140 (-),score=45.71 TRINITY_DN2453_c0_g1_i1:37-435(-)
MADEKTDLDNKKKELLRCIDDAIELMDYYTQLKKNESLLKHAEMANIQETLLHLERQELKEEPIVVDETVFASAPQLEKSLQELDRKMQRLANQFNEHSLSNLQSDEVQLATFVFFFFCLFCGSFFVFLYLS